VARLITGCAAAVFVGVTFTQSSLLSKENNVSDEKDKFATMMAQKIRDALEARGVDPTQLQNADVRVEKAEDLINMDEETEARAKELVMHAYNRVCFLVEGKNTQMFRIRVIGEAMCARPAIMELIYYTEPPTGVMEIASHKLHQMSHLLELQVSLLALCVSYDFVIDITAVGSEKVGSYTSCEYSAALKNLMDHECMGTLLHNEEVMAMLDSEISAVSLALASTMIPPEQLVEATDELFNQFAQIQVH
jgi:hypothetical protein